MKFVLKACFACTQSGKWLQEPLLTPCDCATSNCVSFMVMMHKSLSNWWVFWNQPRMQKRKVAKTINRFQPFCFISYLFLWEWSRPPGPPQRQAPSLFPWSTLQTSTSYRLTVVKGRWTSTVLKCTYQITVVKNCNYQSIKTTPELLKPLPFTVNS